MKRSFRIGIAIVVLLAAIAVAFGLLKLRKAPLAQSPPRALPDVETITVRKVPVRVKLPANGTVEPATSTRAAAEVEGTITWVSPSLVAGGQFREGDVLLEIDNSDYHALHAQAEAMLAEAKLAVVQEEVRAEQALRDWNRIATPGLAPNDLVLRKPQLEAANANVESAKAAVERTLRDLERTKLRAPYTGRVRSKLVDLGTFVGRGTPLTEFYATEIFEVRLPIARADAAFLDPNKQEITLYDPADPDIKWPATIHRTEGEIVRESRSVVVVARLSGADVSAPMPGQFVRTVIEGREIQNLVQVPRRALLSTNRAMVVNPDNTLRTQEVEILRGGQETVLVSSGLNNGDQLCVTTLAAVIEGMSVRVISRDGTSIHPEP